MTTKHNRSAGCFSGLPPWTFAQRSLGELVSAFTWVFHSKPEVTFFASGSCVSPEIANSHLYILLSPRPAFSDRRRSFVNGTFSQRNFFCLEMPDSLNALQRKCPTFQKKPLSYSNKNLIQSHSAKSPLVGTSASGWHMTCVVFRKKQNASFEEQTLDGNKNSFLRSQNRFSSCDLHRLKKKNGLLWVLNDAVFKWSAFWRRASRAVSQTMKVEGVVRVLCPLICFTVTVYGLCTLQNELSRVEASGFKSYLVHTNKVRSEKQLKKKRQGKSSELLKSAVALRQQHAAISTICLVISFQWCI